MSRHRLGLGLACGSMLVVICALTLPIRAERGLERQGARTRARALSTVPVTPVEGLSTLHHLGLTIEGSSMGWAGQWSACACFFTLQNFNLKCEATIKTRPVPVVIYR